MRGLVPVNDNDGLEREADVMGERALSVPASEGARAAPVPQAAAVQRKGVATADLVDAVLPVGKTVALIGEIHPETGPLEEDYFKRHGIGYHSEVSSLTQSYTEEAETGQLTVERDVDDFAVENVPLRALSEVVDLQADHADFRKRYVVPVLHFWADGQRLTDHMAKLVNPRMLTKLSKKLDELKDTFHDTTHPKIKAANSLYLEPLNNLTGEMVATDKALEGTRWQAEASSLRVEFYGALTAYERHDEELSNLMVGLVTSEDFDRFDEAVKALESYCDLMEELLPRLHAFLMAVIADQAPGEATVPGAGTGDDTAISKGRSQAMLNAAVWLSKNTAGREVVKVGEGHIEDVGDVDVDADQLNIIPKDDYYRMQDETETQSLRKV